MTGFTSLEICVANFRFAGLLAFARLLASTGLLLCFSHMSGKSRYLSVFLHIASILLGPESVYLPG